MAYIYLTYSQNFPESDSLSFLCIRKIKQLLPCKEMALLVNTLWWHRLVEILRYITREFYFVSFSKLCKTVRKTGQLQRPFTIPSSQCPISQSYIRLLQLICSWEIQVFPFLPYPTVMEKKRSLFSSCFHSFPSQRPGFIARGRTSGGRGQGGNPTRAPSRLQAPLSSLPNTCPGQAGTGPDITMPKAKAVPVLKG